MLEVQNLHLRRGSNEVLHDINLQLEPGQVLGILGPNGAGKSSLLAALCGELTPSHGQVTLQGKALAQWSGQARAQRLAVLPQVSSLGFAFRVEEVVGMGRLPHRSGRQRDREIVEAALRAADAWHLVERSYLALSGVSVNACTWHGCWLSSGRVNRGPRCCSTNRPPCSILCTSIRRWKLYAALPTVVQQCW